MAKQFGSMREQIKINGTTEKAKMKPEMRLAGSLQKDSFQQSISNEWRGFVCLF